MSSSTLPQTWVKNVYSLCTLGVITGGQSSTVVGIQTTSLKNVGVKPQTYTHETTDFSPYLYTRFLRIFNLLISRFSTLSTPPTITKTKEK